MTRVYVHTLLAHSQREKQRLLAMLFSTSKGEISKSKSRDLDFAFTFPLTGGTCSTHALLQFVEIVLKMVFCLVFFNFSADLELE